MTPDLQAVVKRLDALERELRRIARVGRGMLAISGLIILTIACGHRAWLPAGRALRWATDGLSGAGDERVRGWQGTTL